jgi:uncharacterized protein (DUF305 family)
MKTHPLLILSASATLALAACGGGSSDSQATTADVAPTAAPAAGASFNDTDVIFAQGMIPHHESAIEMSDIALDPAVGASATTRDLATQIKAAQDPEIVQMKALLTAWGQPAAMEMTAEEMANMDGMMSMDDMSALEALTGAGFDKAWAAMMIEHHQGAISMAEAVKAGGSNPEILALAEAIIAGQSKEIDILTPIAAG